MCYTVKQWTKVCPYHHCVDLQICWRQCRIAGAFKDNDGYRDFYRLCNEQDHGLMLPMTSTVSAPIVSSAECATCLGADFGPNVGFNEVIAEDEVIQISHKVLRRDKMTLAAVFHRQLVVAGKREDRREYLQAKKLPVDADELMDEYLQTIQDHGDSIGNLERTIQAKEDFIVRRKKDLINAHGARYFQSKILEFNQTSEWKWRCYSPPTTREMQEMGPKCPYETSMPDKITLARCGTGPGWACNWDVTPIPQLRGNCQPILPKLHESATTD